MGDKEITDLLLEQERSLLNPGTRKTPGQLELLLSEDYLEIGSSGRIYSRDMVMERLQQSPAVLGWMQRLEEATDGPLDL